MVEMTKLIIETRMETGSGQSNSRDDVLDLHRQRREALHSSLDEWLDSLSSYDPAQFTMPFIRFGVDDGVNELEG